MGSQALLLRIAARPEAQGGVRIEGVRESESRVLRQSASAFGARRLARPLRGGQEQNGSNGGSLQAVPARAALRRLCLPLAARPGQGLWEESESLGALDNPSPSISRLGREVMRRNETLLLITFLNYK